ncbi:haloacid dehalogenase-like hydrolase domain-containing protein 3 [Patella vulgata]|uniref:haloacid dehalogenase-like hydrolase domain-containing protein 3 n=1 Tax=Patella vulgata TaxID=6465 RepID=UPI0024A8357C|nr:haloacid dehalogenase-like hydrolase domain-containing protein 3 [Patella vulgata]
MARVIRLVTFDVNNTLCRVSSSVGRHYVKIGNMYGIEATEEEMNKAHKHHYDIYSQKYPNFGVSVNMSPYKWWTNLVRDSFRSVGFTNDEETLTQIANHLYLHFTSAACWEKLPGVDTGLMALRSQDVKMGVISNFDERLEKILKNVAISHQFDFILTSTKAGFEKPDVKIFQKALEIAGVEAQDAVHVGDNIEKDYFGARNAGWRSYVVSQETLLPKVNPEHIVKTLNDFVLLLDKL